MKIVEEKNVVNEEMKEGGFYKLLEKICKDFNVKDSKRIIKNFIEKQ